MAVSGASNVLGTINHLEGLARTARRHGARILVDAAQLVAHRPIEMAESGIDYLAFSAHKIYAPFGSGALVVRRGLLQTDPSEWAAIKASGEENVAGIAALGKALILLQRAGLEAIAEQERGLTRRVLEGLARIPGTEIFGLRDPLSPRFPDKGPVVSFALGRVPHNRVASELAELGGIGVRHGCFCAHLLIKRMLGIHPLRAKAADLGMVLFPRFTSRLLPGLVRVSLGLENDESDVDHLLHTLNRITEKPRPAAERIQARIHCGAPFQVRSVTQVRMEEFTTDAVRRIFGLSLLDQDYVLPQVRIGFSCREEKRMKRNVGVIDRVLRMAVGVAIIAAGLYYRDLWGLLGIGMFLSGLLGYCPLYALFGLSSRNPRSE